MVTLCEGPEFTGEPLELPFSLWFQKARHYQIYIRIVSSFRSWTKLFLFSELYSNNWRIPLQTPRGYKLPSSSVCDSIPQGNFYEIITEVSYLSSMFPQDLLLIPVLWSKSWWFIHFHNLYFWAAREMWVQSADESYRWWDEMYLMRWELQKPWLVVCMQTTRVTQIQAEDGAGGGEWDRGVGVAWRLGSQQKK